jgi:hypothetical protein
MIFKNFEFFQKKIKLKIKIIIFCSVGYEWHWAHNEPETMLRVGQLLIEVHTEGVNQKYFPGLSLTKGLIEVFENNGVNPNIFFFKNKFTIPK